MVFNAEITTFQKHILNSTQSFPYNSVQKSGLLMQLSTCEKPVWEENMDTKYEWKIFYDSKVLITAETSKFKCQDS